MDDAGFKLNNNFRNNYSARVCCNCVHYCRSYEEEWCMKARRDVDYKYFMDMPVNPNNVCDLFEQEFAEDGSVVPKEEKETK